MATRDRKDKTKGETKSRGREKSANAREKAANPREKGSKAKKKSRKKERSVDKFALYQRAVQEPEADIEFMNEVFAARFGRPPHTMREDFCAAAHLSCEWIKDHKKNRAWGIDLDPQPLAWGLANNASTLSAKQRRRLTLIEGDVLDVRHEPVDVVAAFNFSYYCLQTRAALRDYFEAARANLGDEGLFLLDIYGGPEAQQLVEESTEHDDFSYVWDQDEFDPINSRMVCYIHFDTPDGERIERAFAYDWRLWTILELREVLTEAGFDAVEVHWEGADEESGEGDGNFTLQETAENTESWIAYVIGVKDSRHSGRG